MRFHPTTSQCTLSAFLQNEANVIEITIASALLEKLTSRLSLVISTIQFFFDFVANFYKSTRFPHIHAKQCPNCQIFCNKQLKAVYKFILRRLAYANVLD